MNVNRPPRLRRSISAPAHPAVGSLRFFLVYDEFQPFYTVYPVEGANVGTVRFLLPGAIEVTAAEADRLGMDEPAEAFDRGAEWGGAYLGRHDFNVDPRLIALADTVRLARVYLAVLRRSGPRPDPAAADS